MTTINRELNARLNNLEKYTVREMNSNCEPELLKQVSESPIKKDSEHFKCNYTGKTSVSLKKHINTKHLHDFVIYSNREESEFCLIV